MRLSDIWRRCLSVRGIERPVFLSEINQIRQKVRTDGCEAVKMAIVGARFETWGEGFDPRQFLTLTRIFNEKNFLRMANLGAIHLDKKKKKRELNDKLDEIASQTPYLKGGLSDEQVKEFKKRFVNNAGLSKKDSDSCPLKRG